MENKNKIKNLSLNQEKREFVNAWNEHINELTRLKLRLTIEDCQRLNDIQTELKKLVIKAIPRG